MIRQKLDSERKTERQPEGDEVLLEVNISQRGCNGRDELGLGLWDVASENERKRSKLGGTLRGEEEGKMKNRQTEVTRGARSGKTCLRNALHPLRGRRRKSPLFSTEGHFVVFQSIK